MALNQNKTAAAWPRLADMPFSIVNPGRAHGRVAIGTGAELFNISGQQQWGLNRAFFNKINSEIWSAVWHIPKDTRHLYLYKIKGAFTQSNFLFQHQRAARKRLLEGGTQHPAQWCKRLSGKAACSASNVPFTSSDMQGHCSLDHRITE